MDALAYEGDEGRGKLGIMDYYKMENIKSDTGMRDAIAGSDTETSDDNPVQDN